MIEKSRGGIWLYGLLVLSVLQFLLALGRICLCYLFQAL